MEFFKGREVNTGDVVHVYRNLNTGNFSIRCSKTQKVLAHARTVQLKDCTCTVSKSGRDKTLLERRKRVHAWIKGTFISADQDKKEEFNRVIYYDPYKTEQFVDLMVNKPVYHLVEAHFEGSVVYSRGEHALRK
ncbi:hypothetical protein K7887_22125 (plasmid) [Sutcliffiella horikoshii]|uniref:hypothetical protein n=1 Tax=Sutcliffiella horikoshii TaxID=79883 RepID=UPI001CBCF09A|nr:hypothetical protein [Sutcliffiella horikoshii]UAL49819.1 hypothetical protein K7887_22125 [Sutcliffiella horikoshii]